MAKLPMPDYIISMVEWRFPNSYIPQQLSYQEGDGPMGGDMPLSNPDAEKFRQELLVTPLKELDALYAEARKIKWAKDDKERFFNQPNANADYKHWGRMTYWTLDEAIILTFGKDPRIVYPSRLKETLSYTSPFITAHQELQQVAGRAKAWRKLFDPVLPALYIAWVKNNGYVFPSELEAEVVKRGGYVGDWKNAYEALKKQFDEVGESQSKITAKIEETVETQSRLIALNEEEIRNLKAQLADKPEKSVSTRERETYLKIIIGMAVGGYAHDPKATRSATASEIAGDIARVGLSVDEDTVRKRLKEAAELVPQKSSQNQDS